MIEHGFLGIKYARSYQWLHEKYHEQVNSQYTMQKEISTNISNPNN